MTRLQYIYRKLINSLFGDVEAFFGLPLKWKIRGALAIGFLYLAIVVLVFMVLYPSQIAELESVVVLVIGYVFLFIGMTIIVLPIFIRQLQKYPTWVVAMSIVSFAISFSILLGKVSASVDTPIFIAFYVGLIAVAFGSRLYSRVIKEVVSEKVRIDTEIKLAQKIQTDLLPVIDVDEDRYQVFGKTVNAQEVGGDFFDVVKLDEQRVAFCVGDVSGHNIAAGLFVGIVKSAFRTELRYNSSLTLLTTSLNTTVIEQGSKGMFVSFAAGIINLDQADAEFINAGHPPIIYLHNRGDKIEEIKLNGAALGLSDSINFKSMKLKINSSDIFVCYSDGLIEMTNGSGDEFGKERLINELRTVNSPISAHKLYQAIHEQVKNFTKDNRQKDDITLMVFKIK